MPDYVPNSLEAKAVSGSMSQPDNAPTPTTTDAGPAPDLGTPAPSNGGGLQANVGTPDLPRFQRTFGNTLKGILLGTALNGIPGGIVGAIDPRAPERQRQDMRQADQAKITFANAQAAHEVAMAHQADAEYQALPQKLQDEATARELGNVKKATDAGYVPVASVPLDQGADQNSQNASTALNSVVSKFGAVPQGLLYIHTGTGMTVMKLQDPNAALPSINQARRAQGMPEITQDQFGALPQADKDGMARNAINFTNPRDVNGMVSQQSLNEANMRLATVKAQPDFNGKDTLVSQLEANVKHQKAVLDSGAEQAATRTGAAAGAEAQAAQPGKTAAEVADINATAGPKAAAAGQAAQATEAGRQKAINSAGDGSGTTLVDEIGTGKMAVDRLGYLLAKNPALLQAVAAKYPDFDNSKVGTYVQASKEFSSSKNGTAGNALNSGSTALEHLQELYDLNTVASHIPGTPAYNRYENKVDTLATELAKFYGDSTIPAIASIKKTLNTTLPGNREAAIRTQAQSMGRKFDNYEQQWNDAAPSAAYHRPMPGISDRAKQARAALDPAYAAKQSGQGQQPVYASAPGKPRLMSMDGGKTWQTAPAAQ